jgi:hypothetical protein
MFPEVTHVRFWFKQPHLELITDHTFTREQIPALYLRVQRIVMRARDAAARVAKEDFSSATPAVPVCNFCANLGKCDKVLGIMGKLGAKFYPLEIPEDITPSIIHSRENTGLALRLAQVVKVWADAFRAQVTNRVLEGRSDLPEGFGIQTAQKRVLVSKEKFKEVALKYLTEQEYIDSMEVLFGAVEDKVKDKASRGAKTAAVNTFKQELDAAGATMKGDPFSYLKATPKTKSVTESK